MEGAGADEVQWLRVVKSDVLSSPEWLELRQLLLQELDAKVEVLGIENLSSLNEAERRLVMEQVVPALTGTSAFKIFKQSASSRVGKALLTDVAASTANQAAAQGGGEKKRGTNSELFIERASQGAVWLLQRNPENKLALRGLVNVALPSGLRSEMWRSWLARPSVAQAWTDAPATHMLSQQHQTLSQVAAGLLHGSGVLGTDPSVVQAMARYGAHDSLQLVRSVVTYTIAEAERKFAGVGFGISDMEALVCTCVILAQTFPKEREADVVGYFGALCSHPRTVGLLTGSNQWKEDDGWLEFCASSSRLMLRVDPELHQALCTCWSVAQGASGPDGPWDSMCNTLVAPRVARMFVAAVEPEAVLYIVDQVLLGGGRAAFPLFAVIDLLLRRELIIPISKSSPNPEAISSAVQSSAPLSLASIRHAVDRRELVDELRMAVGLPKVGEGAVTPRDAPQGSSAGMPAVATAQPAAQGALGADAPSQAFSAGADTTGSFNAARPEGVPALDVSGIPNNTPGPRIKTPHSFAADNMTPPPSSGRAAAKALAEKQRLEREQEKKEHEQQSAAAGLIGAAFRGHQVRKMKIVQRAQDPDEMLRRLLGGAVSAASLISTPEPTEP